MLHISLSPNVEKDDIALCWRTLFSPFKWNSGGDTQALQVALSDYFDRAPVYLTNSGRSALFCILKGCNVSKGDEVIVQSFSCNAVVNPILWVGAKPVYADIHASSYNFNINSVKQKITKNTKAIIVQHSFGISSPISDLRNLCDAYKIILIEDCAHALGMTYQGKKAGTIGDVALLSFGRDKVISCVYGGAVVAHKYSEQIQAVYKTYKKPRTVWTLQQLIHPLVTTWLLRMYSFGGSKALWLLQRLSVLSKAVSKQERVGQCPSYFPAQLPNGLAILALHQFAKLEKFNNHRKQLAGLYENALKNAQSVTLPKALDGSIFLRYPIQHKNAQQILRKGYKRKFILGDWYRNVIDPRGTNMKIMQYAKGDTPVAEAVARDTMNLPTNIKTTKQDAQNIVQFIIENS